MKTLRFETGQKHLQTICFVTVQKKHTRQSAEHLFLHKNIILIILQYKTILL